MPVDFEMVQVSKGVSNTKASGDHCFEQTDWVEAKNIRNVMESSRNLAKHTYAALKDGYYPIVVGGDHSQAIGSISGLKKAYPDAKLLWMDAHIDANTPESSPSRNAHGMPLAYLSGIVPFHRAWKCMDLDKDLCYFGIRSYEEDELALIKSKNVLVFESKVCEGVNLPKIDKVLSKYFSSRLRNAENPYWVSFDIDSVDASEFGSTGTAEFEGLSLDFTKAFMEEFIPRSVGMDFTEVNFELAKDDEQRR